MNSVTRLLPLLIACLFAVAQVGAVPLKQLFQPPAEEDWTEAHYRIFTNHGNRLDPSEVRDLLLKLEKIYAPLQDLATNQRKSKVAKLLDASKLDLDHCTREKFVNLDNMASHYDVYWKNVVPYLTHCMEELLYFCTENYGAVLRKNLVDHRVLSDDVHKLEVLKNNLTTWKTKFGEMNLFQAIDSEERVISVGVNYIFAQIAKSPELLDQDRIPTGSVKCVGVKSAKEFRKLFSEVIDVSLMNTCRRWIRAVDIVFVLTSLKANLVLKADEETWIENYFVCRQFIDHEMDIEAKLRHHFRMRGTVMQRIRNTGVYKNLREKMRFMERYRHRRLVELVEHHEKRQSTLAQQQAQQLSD